MSSDTLTSLAMLKVHVDRGEDYLDYLRPFILQVIFDNRPNSITDMEICRYIRKDFGLEIPNRAIQVVLKRLARKNILNRDHGIFQIQNDVQDPGIRRKRVNANRHISAVTSGLISFSKDTKRPITSKNEAEVGILAFLSRFNIQCLKAYIRGTTIPNVTEFDDTLLFVVSKYVIWLQQHNPERFDSFLTVVKGHMLANALLCPDLQQAPKSFKGITFFFDTPLLIRSLGLEGEERKAAIENLITLLNRLGARLSTFSHSRNELESVIKAAADHVDKKNGRGNIVFEARRNKKTKSDLLILVGQIDARLSGFGIEVIDTPKYIEKFQIDEDKFQNILEDELDYLNPRAKEYDINSVRSIYALREGISPNCLERCKAVLVTSNSAFSKAAFEFGKDYEESREVSSVITDFSLANIAWLKVPLGAPDLPMTEAIAFSYAALQPSKELLDKYMTEIEKLERDGTISEEDHQLLRSSELARKELMNLTMGEEQAITEKTITETLDRIKDDIKKEEKKKYQAEYKEHQKTVDRLREEREKRKKLHEGIFWRCKKRAKQFAWIITSLIGMILITGTILGALNFKSSHKIISLISLLPTILVILWTLINFFRGATLPMVFEKIESYLQKALLKRESKILDIEFEKIK